VPELKPSAKDEEAQSVAVRSWMWFPGMIVVAFKFPLTIAAVMRPITHRLHSIYFMTSSTHPLSIDPDSPVMDSGAVSYSNSSWEAPF
jgi:hypothetical protein